MWSGLSANALRWELTSPLPKAGGVATIVWMAVWYLRRPKPGCTEERECHEKRD